MGVSGQNQDSTLATAMVCFKHEASPEPIRWTSGNIAPASFDARGSARQPSVGLVGVACSIGAMAAVSKTNTTSGASATSYWSSTLRRKALEIEIPPTLLAMANRVIE
jgi:hypothetical protein